LTPMPYLVKLKILPLTAAQFRDVFFGLLLTDELFLDRTISNG
jgi:hypothetical protein